MKKNRRTSHRKTTTFALLALAGVLLMGSALGSTRAALTYYSENYTAEIKIHQIGVSLLENGEVVSSRDYEGDKWNETSGALLQNMLGENEKLALGKKYDETLSVLNSGDIDQYVRVRIYKYWTKKGSDEKETSLSPDLIKLNLVNQEQWINPNPEVTDRECTELYYKGILPAGQTAVDFADGISIDNKLAAEVEVTQKGNVITTTYKYDGVEFHVNVEVDAVQTHNAQDAILSAWGVDAAALGIL
ncbi:MAG: hypothetical protein ACOYBL_06910 [Lachnospiraceae bacterium]|jgi:hypothetical protein